jgi:hypothetical protein
MLPEGQQPFQKEVTEVPYPVPQVLRVALIAQCQRPTLNLNGRMINMMRYSNSLITQPQVVALGGTPAKINLPLNTITRISILIILEAPRASKLTIWEETTTISTVTGIITTITKEEEGKLSEGITRCSSSIRIAITSSPSRAPPLTPPRSSSSSPSTTPLPANIMREATNNMAIMAATHTGRNA